MHEYLDSIAEWSGAAEDWRPISRGAILAWLIFYVIFLLYAFRMHGGYLFIDSANLVVHEGGHLLFRWFGPTLCLWGGTILQWMVPLLLTVYFFHERQPAAFVFCLFFFLRTGSTRRLTWPTRVPWFCPWLPPEIPITPSTTGTRYFQAWDFWITTRPSPPSCGHLAGAECWPAQHG